MKQKQLTLDAKLANSESGAEQLILKELRKFRQVWGGTTTNLRIPDMDGDINGQSPW